MEIIHVTTAALLLATLMECATNKTIALVEEETTDGETSSTTFETGFEQRNKNYSSDCKQRAISLNRISK